ncbi:MAG: hypothetical protein ACOCVY_02045 [Patescibacteria group bacterium]
MKKAIFLGAGLIFLLAGCSGGGEGNTISSEEAGQKGEKFVNENFMEDGQGSATVADVSEKKGLYQMDIQVQGQTIEAYMTKDGKTFFPQAVDMDNPPQQDASQQGQQQQASPQQEMSPSEQAESMISQGEGLLDQFGDSISDEEKSDLEGAIDDLEELNDSEDAGDQELQEQMQEVQKATEPMIEAVQEQQQQQGQQQGQGNNTAPQVQPGQ